MPLSHIDCFCGPGGFCTGLHAAGFDTKVAIDYVESCTHTYKANHPDVHVIHGDIRSVTAKDILPYIPEEGVDLVTSGMPCETFSTAGNSSRSFYDDRQVLFREGIRIAKIAKAKMILFENVPAIRTKKLYKDSDELVVTVLDKELRAAGYNNVKEFVLSAADYGVPQNRERYFVLASTDDAITLVPPVPQFPASTVRDAFAGLPNVLPNTADDMTEYTGEESEYSLLLKNDQFWKREDLRKSSLIHQHPMKHRKSTLKRFSLIKKGENLGALFDRLSSEEIADYQKHNILPKKKFIGRNIRLDYDSQSPTVTSHCLDEFLHPEYDRALTVRECARLQSFPDSYVFCGPYLIPHNNREVQDKYEQIGDAVPPLLAYAWGKTIEQLLESYDA